MSGRELLYTIFDQHKEAGRRHGHMRVTVPRINCSNSTGAYQPLVNATNNVEAGPSGKCASCLGIVLEGSVLDVAHVPTWHHACETAVGRRSSLISIDACTSPTVQYACMSVRLHTPKTVTYFETTCAIETPFNFFVSQLHRIIALKNVGISGRFSSRAA